MSKTSTKKAVTPQLTDSILTRYKTAQQGRQLRKKDRSMKSITQLLKSSSQRSSSAGHLQKNPGKYKNMAAKKCTQKSSTNKKVSTDHTNGSKTNQLPRNILKKSVPEKKITLKPKYEMKVIARANKRKLNTPHKGLISSPAHIATELDRSSSDKEVCKSNGTRFSSELTMSDIVRLAEEADCLDDEDLMEILTCPSPVWWEDPPDDNYVEDPIFIRIPTNMAKEQDIVNNNKDTKHKTKGNNDTLDIVVKINDTRIIEKRNKLEKILGNIKNKFDSNVCDSNKINYKSDRQLKEATSNNNTNEVNMVTINAEGNEYDVLLSDISINGEELLKELENMDIPIEGDKKNTDNNLEKQLTNENSNSIVKIKLIDKLNNELTFTGEDRKTSNVKAQLRKPPAKKFNTASSRTLLNLSTDTASSTEFESISDLNIQNQNDGDKRVAKSNLVNSCSAKNDIVNRKTKDPSIKDTQFFLDEDKKKLVTVSTDTEAMSDFESYIDKSDFITVYKIMSQKYTNNDDNGVARHDNPPNPKENTKKIKSKQTQNDSKLNLFYKKRKNTMKSPKRIVKSQKVEAKNLTCNFCKRNSFLPIPDCNEKLCLRCSSIYEESCTFCDTDDSKEECTCAVKKPNPKLAFSCNECKFLTNTIIEARKHLKTSHSDAVSRHTWKKCFTVIKND